MQAQATTQWRPRIDALDTLAPHGGHTMQLYPRTRDFIARHTGYEARPASVDEKLMHGGHAV